jgi:hypothetical protein
MASDDAEKKTGVETACHFITHKFGGYLHGKELPLQKSFLSQIGNWFGKLKVKSSGAQTGQDSTIASDATSPSSGNSDSPFALKGALEALFYSFGQVKDQANPLGALFAQLQGRVLSHEVKVPKIMFSLFNGGKTLGSKVKFRRIYLIVDMKPEDSDTIDALQLYYKISAAIKKGVSTHKQGESVFKPSAVGVYWNAHENHNETLKVIEDAIASVGVNVSHPLRPYHEHCSLDRRQEDLDHWTANGC